MSTDHNRLALLAEFGLRQQQEDPSLQQLMQAVANLLDVPTALVSLIGSDLQFFKARVGLDAATTRREDAFCDHVVASEEAMVIEDTLSDPRFCQNPLVTGEPHIRFYAGVPLRLKQQTVGAVCVIDSQPRHLSQSQLTVLHNVSAHITNYLTLLREHQHLQQEHSLLDNSPAVLMKWRYYHGLQLKYVSANIDVLFGLPLQELRTQTARFEDFIEHAGLSEFNFLLNNHMAGVVDGEAHFQVLSPNRKTYWVKLISKAFFNTDGTLDAIHAMLVDHTTNRYVEQKLTQTNQQMRLLLDASGLGTWDWYLPSDKSKVNRRWCDMIGIDYELYDSSSQYWQSLVHPADALQLRDEISRHLRGDTQVLNTIYRMRHSDGHWVWIETYGKVVERASDGSPVRLAGTHRDITYRKEAELLETKQRQLLSFTNKAQAAYLRDHNLSQACREVLSELTQIADIQFAFIGQMRRQAGKDRLFLHAITEFAWNEESHQLVAMYHNNDLYFDNFNNLFGQVITSKQVIISNEPHNHPASRGTPAGHPKIFRFLGLPILLNNELVGMIGLANKLTHYTSQDAEFLQPFTQALAGLYYAVDMEDARFKAEEQLKNLAMQDPLTGIANRRAFIEHCSRLKNTDTGYVLVIIDIDHFKQVNDRYGHLAGDDVICAIAKLLQHGLRSDDFVARLGGEEFAVVIEHTEVDTASLILEAMLLQIASEPIVADGKSLFVTVSMGARYVSPDEQEDITLQLSQADSALYKAKDNGRNCVMWY